MPPQTLASVRNSLNMSSRNAISADVWKKVAIKISILNLRYFRSCKSFKLINMIPMAIPARICVISCMKKRLE